MENTNVKSGAKDFFMHLLSFGLLYVFAVSFIALWWQYINIKFPDAINQYYSYGYESLRWPMAVLIIVFPIFVILARLTTKAIAAEPARKDARIYRWLIYLTMFVAAVTVIVDLISLLYGFLGGELTSRFALKALTVLIVAAGIFGYYLWHLRSDVSQTARGRHALLWSSIIIVIGSIVLGFFIVGSPATARKQKFDQQRVNDLQNIQWQIQDEYQRTSKLPQAPNITSLDPQTGQPYEYRVTGAETYQLCATFTLESHYPNNDQDPWRHPAGYHCFELNVKNIPSGKPLPLPYNAVPPLD